MKWIRIIIVALLLTVLAVLVSSSESTLWQTLGILASGLSGAMITSIYEFIDSQGQSRRIWYETKIKYRKERIYLSFSYLYKIEVDGKYLLIRGNRLKNQYQPIGGVYKYYPEGKDRLESMECLSDVRMGNGQETDDLRLTIPAPNVIGFLTWFKEMRDREYDPRREFYEELVQNGLVSADKFRHFHYRKVSVHDKGITWSDFNKCHEYIFADVFELVLNDNQKNEIRRAVNDNPEQLCLASLEEIERGCYHGIERNLGSNVTWIIGG